MATFGGDVSDLVPDPVAAALKGPPARAMKLSTPVWGVWASACKERPGYREPHTKSPRTRRLTNFQWTYWSSSTSWTT